MHYIRTQPAGPKAFRLYAIVRDTYRQDIGERAFAVYEALTYYVDSKTLAGAIPLKLLAETIQTTTTTVSRHLNKLVQLGLITITPQWDAYECVRSANIYTLDTLPLRALALQRTRMETTAIAARQSSSSRGTLLHLSSPARPRLKGKVKAQMS